MIAERFSRTGRAIIGVGLFFCLGWATPAAADTAVTITATVGGDEQLPNPIVEFRGYAAPNARLTVLRDGAAAGSTTVGSSAAFTIQLADQPTGQVSYQVVATDTAGQTLAPLTFALNLTLGTNTIITGVFLGPSIAVDKSSVKLGQFVTLSGATAPSSAVTVTVGPVQAASYSIVADTDGRWSKLVNTQDIGVGTHAAFVQAVIGGNQISAASAVVAFAVNPLGQCDGKRSADLNCNTTVDLVDFSILLYFWGQVTPSNSRADINGDGRVDIIDFSIMLYQWTA